MPREKRNVRPPQYYDPEVESSKPQWASPFSPFPTPPRQPVVYMTGNHMVPDVGLGTTVVAPPTSAVAIPPPPPYPPPPMPAVAPPMPAVYPLVFPPTSAVAAGGSAVAAPTPTVVFQDPLLGVVYLAPPYAGGCHWWLSGCRSVWL